MAALQQEGMRLDISDRQQRQLSHRIHGAVHSYLESKISYLEYMFRVRQPGLTSLQMAIQVCCPRELRGTERA